MKNNILTLILLSIFSSATWAAGEVSCKKIVPINQTEGWKRHCTYHGTSLHQAYQAYREVSRYLTDVPENLPNRNRKFISRDDVEIGVMWKGKNSVMVSQISTDSDSGVEVWFKKSGRNIHIQELGWTP